RCRADGITHDLKPDWLDFLAIDHPNEDVMWFDRERVWPARTGGAPLEPMPDRASEIVLALAQCRDLWPIAPGRNTATQPMSTLAVLMFSATGCNRSLSVTRIRRSNGAWFTLTGIRPCHI